MHGCIRFGELVDEHDLYKITHFAAEGGSLSSLPWRLFAELAEGAVFVTTVQGFEVSGVVGDERRCSWGDVQGDLYSVSAARAVNRIKILTPIQLSQPVGP